MPLCHNLDFGDAIVCFGYDILFLQFYGERYLVNNSCGPCAIIASLGSIRPVGPRRRYMFPFDGDSS